MGRTGYLTAKYHLTRVYSYASGENDSVCATMVPVWTVHDVGDVQVFPYMLRRVCTSFAHIMKNLNVRFTSYA